MEPVEFLQIANIFFFVFHGLIIFINLFGWMIWKFRKVHYSILGLTFFSWFFLGIFYGFGYCFLTDWHYEILRKLGYSNIPNSYIKFCLDSILETNLDPFWVDIGTVSGLVFGMLGAGFNLVRGRGHSPLKSKEAEFIQ